MSLTLAHRGPSDHGTWADPEAGLALGHRRLSILDLSPHGRQPMSSPNGRYVLTYNGEVYNHLELRRRLETEGRGFVGTSDTETLVHAIEAWGLPQTLPLLVGMFAIALWDRQLRELTLVRDRLGQKPLYYGKVGGNFVFGSELSALKAAPGFDNPIDPGAVAEYLAFRYVPCPLSIYRGIQKLPPAHLLTLRSPSDPSPPRAYWSAREAALHGVRHPFTGNYAQGVETLQSALVEAVRSQTVSDVPLGTFLSGGIDSALVTAMLHAGGCQPLRTFTIGVPDPRYNESEVAGRVARHFGTVHELLNVGEADLLDVVPRLGSIYDEPFADSSQVPTYLVSKLCRSQITVALSGDGGDELFGGYNRYTWGPSLWRRIRRLPPRLRGLVARALGLLPEDRVEKLAPLLRVRLLAQKLRKLAQVLPARDREELYLKLVTDTAWPEPVLRAGAPSNEWQLAEQMMVFDSVTYLPDDIHTKVDRASMAVSLEVRAPFMDHRLFELAWTLPFDWKITTQGVGKSILRDILARHLPREIFDQPKMGFAVPIGDWLRGPLRSWADELLRRPQLVDPTRVARMWREHTSGRRSWEHELWTVLMLESWR